MYLLNCLRKIKYFALGKCPKNGGVALNPWKSKDIFCTWKPYFWTLINLLKLCLFCVLIDKIVIRPQLQIGNLNFPKFFSSAKTCNEIAFTATKEELLSLKVHCHFPEQKSGFINFPGTNPVFTISRNESGFSQIRPNPCLRRKATEVKRGSIYPQFSANFESFLGGFCLRKGNRRLSLSRLRVKASSQSSESSFPSPTKIGLKQVP